MVEPQAFFQISLLAAFIAGMVALFAPCCISYLFPAYLANIFKERKQVLFMTLIYSLGIFVVMLPVVLGARILTAFFMQFHDYAYIVGGIFMIVIAVFSLLGVKLPMPRLSMKQKTGKPDIASTFTLGIFSGITSACCAPVLVGVMTLSSLSYTTLGALSVGMAYVLGMVSPLYLASLFISKRNILEKPILRKKVTEVFVFGKKYQILVSNLISGAIFFITGVAMMILSVMGKLSMPVGDDSVTKKIGAVALSITDLTDKISGLNLIFIILLVLFLYYIFKEIKGGYSSQKKKPKSEDCCSEEPTPKK